MRRVSADGPVAVAVTHVERTGEVAGARSVARFQRLVETTPDDA